MTINNETLIKNALRGSNHPLSRMLYEFLPECKRLKIIDFEEITGKGINANIDGNQVKIGSFEFISQNSPPLEGSEEDAASPSRKADLRKTSVHIKINEMYFGRFIFNNQYREGLVELFEKLKVNYEIKILSGDNEGEREFLQNLLPKETELLFNQKPEQKLEFIKKLQNEGKNVMMVGDGLNDAGALAQSNIGIAISENVNVFSPACDAILDANEFKKLDYFLKLSKKSIITIKMSFVLSILYNIIGLSFAITGNLSPLVAAIIMPLSTVTIVSFVTILTNFYAQNLK